MIGRESLGCKLETIAQQIIKIMDTYGDENCMIIATNKKDSYTIYNVLKDFGRSHKVTYYKANDTIGVSSDARVCIAIGAAHKPSNAYDAMTDSKYESLVLREEAMHCDTWQAWNRVKDPSGKEPSIVFALGVTEDQCKQISTWGFGRRVEIENIGSETMQRKKINLSFDEQNISKPIIRKCKNFDKMLSDAVLHKHSKKMVISQPKKSLLYNNNREFSLSQVKSFSQCDFLRALCFRDDVFAEQIKFGKNKGKYRKIPSKITDALLKNHIAGEITIGVYTLNPENKVSWMCFDVDAHANDDDTEETIAKKQKNAEYSKDKLCNFFTSTKIPYVLETSGTPYSYHIWIFLKPVSAETARYYGESVLKECDIKKMEVFPKQTRITKNGYGNLVKLPLSVNQKNGNRSKIWIDGEWKEHFDTIELQAVDISKFTVPEVRKKDCYNPTKKQKADGVRLFFTWALQQILTGEQGHWLRIGIVREYYNNGTKDPEQLANLFKLQPDFDFNISLEKVYSIIKDDYGCWKWETIKRMCPDFVNKFNNRE